MMRQSLRELYGLEGSLCEQYSCSGSGSLRRRFRPVAVGVPDAGLGADRARAALDRRAADRCRPCSPGCSATCSAALPATTANSRMLKVARRRRHGAASDPLLHRRLRAADHVRLSSGRCCRSRGGSQMNLPQRLDTRRSSCSVLQHSILPALSLVLVGLGGWFLGMRSLVSNIVTEDYVVYAELGGVDRRRILRFLRDAQRAGAAGDRPCHVARRASSTAPSSPSRCSAIPASARCWWMPSCRRLQPGARRHHGLDRRASSVGVLVIDLLYPLLDPRVKVG